MESKQRYYTPTGIICKLTTIIFLNNYLKTDYGRQYGSLIKLYYIYTEDVG